MSSYTYPVARPEGTLTAAQIHLLLQNPRVIAKRVADLAKQRFIADYLLSGRFTAIGGGIFYETGEQIFAADSPEAIAPGGEYPLTVLTRGDLAAAKTGKWGLDTEITDEAISRLGQRPVDTALVKLANSVIRTVDTIAMGVIASKVTGTFASAAAWTTVSAVVGTLLAAKSNREDLALGLDLSTVALSGSQYAKVMALFVAAGVLPRENGNPIVAGSLPQQLMGFTWVTSPYIVGSDPMLIDRDQLGGMADEDLGSPGYAKSGGSGVETYVQRIGENDKYRGRARRVTVPVVLEPLAGLKVTGTGL
ncbi:hypothetical protein E3O55_08465 [Cryobacterium sp. MDB1-18-2]|uniref:phage major capsid protein n=1 Tax=unclassified Cryobacterium TaxID=2649013 RepID=UPI00106D97DB|nr:MULTISPECIES: hypothetical protein [unclassified Cryobacterium]TFC30106.1 hypothetical protein E3O55_08465 [Cryobacterium sp. MDB1-18-2]TFC41386.1 hypothetical protein E3O50_09905 [Cryobacterium sp. MDB1-18-1]